MTLIMLIRKALIFTLAIAAPVIQCRGEVTKQWPFDQPALEHLQKQKKKVFAHYFSPFPVSLSNRQPDKDYYEKGFIDVNGENGKHKGYGGFIRQRPLPRLPRHEDKWQLADKIDEVKNAHKLGLDGFCFDILDVDGRHWKKFMTMLEAVNKLDNGFKIMLMPDMMAQLRRSPDLFVPMVEKLADNPALYRLEDGRLVIAPYNAQIQSPEWWKKTLGELEAKGIKVAFMPVFQAWWDHIEEYAELSFGFSDWGCSAIDEQETKRRYMLKNVDRHELKFMAPVRPQDFRPKIYHGSESGNSALYREMWSTAMDHNAEWVQIVTWNDYSEGSEIAPSTRTRHSFYDLTAYYTTWFKTETQPEIVRDAIYYFYRIQPVDAEVDLTKQKKKFSLTGKAINEIELLAFMTEPGTLEISIGGKSFKKYFEAGINSFSIPTANGRPVFKLIRDDKAVMTKTGAWEISDKVVFDNLMVHGDGGTAFVDRDYSSPRKPPAIKLNFGEIIKAVTDPESSTFKQVSGDPAKVTLSDEKTDAATVVKSADGSFAVKVGPYGAESNKKFRSGTIHFGGENSIKEGQEMVFRVKELGIDSKNGWSAVFLSIHKKDGGKISLTLRSDSETYVSAALPKFAVKRGNFPVEYPAVYRIRKQDGKLQFIYNNNVMYSYDEADVGEFEQVSLYAGCQDISSSIVVNFSGIELRQNP